MIKAIIFDFDGVVVDTETAKFKELQNILKHRGLVLKKKDFKDMIGKKTGAFLSMKFPQMHESEINRIVDVRRRRLLSNFNGELIPGIKRLLGFIKSRKVRITLTTGSTKKIVEKILQAKGIKGFFDLIVTGEDFKQSKPSPECYEKTLERLKLSPSEVIVIEDAIAGIKAAKSAKCTVWGITTYLNKRELREADKKFTSHIKILRCLKKSFL
jgi:beta-phosphoglucomutase-like phosphatase (HAD superfamily)